MKMYDNIKECKFIGKVGDIMDYCDSLDPNHEVLYHDLEKLNKDDIVLIDYSSPLETYTITVFTKDMEVK